MKIFLNIIAFLSFLGCFSQGNFEQAPQQYRKIRFTYEKQTNYFLDENGVYADSLLFLVDFPEMKQAKAKHPDDPAKVCGFVNWNNWKEEDKKRLFSVLYHVNETIEGVYDSKKNKTTITVRRDDAKTNEMLKKYFNQSQRYFKYSITIDYGKKTIGKSFRYSEHLKTFGQEQNEIVFNYGHLAGRYKMTTPKFVFENIIVLNDKLDEKIVPGELFSNNTFGVEKITGIMHTINLKSVTYE